MPIIQPGHVYRTKCGKSIKCVREKQRNFDGKMLFFCACLDDSAPCVYDETGRCLTGRSLHPPNNKYKYYSDIVSEIDDMNEVPNGWMFDLPYDEYMNIKNLDRMKYDEAIDALEDIQ